MIVSDVRIKLRDPEHCEAVRAGLPDTTEMVVVVWPDAEMVRKAGGWPAEAILVHQVDLDGDTT